MKHMKKLISLILTAVMLFSCMTVCVTADTVEPGSNGDPNGDGKIDLFDVALILQYIAGWEIEGEFIFDAAEVTLDDKVTLTDATRILQYIAHWSPVRWHVPTQEYYDWLAVCADLRDQKLPIPTFDEWLVEQGIDLEKYYEWEQARYDLKMIPYEEWLAEQEK